MKPAITLLFFSLSSVGATAQTEAQRPRDRGVALYREGRFVEAAHAFEEAAELDPGSLELWESLGWAYRKAGRPDEAKEVWSRILKVDPERASLWSQLAAIDIEGEDWTAAADSLEKSLSLEPDEGHVRLRLAMALESAGRLEEAAQAYEELSRRDPENITAILRLASFYERAGEIGKALEALTRAQRRIPRFAHIFSLHIARLEARKADRAYAAGDFTRAIEGYREAVESNPRDPGYLENLGWAHRKAGDLEEAVEVWRLARARNPKDPALARHLADALRESGKTEEAKPLYLEAWEMAPLTDEAVPFRLAELALDELRPEEAVQWIEALFRFPRADDSWSERIAGLFARYEAPGPGLRVFGARRGVSMAPRETAAAESRLQALAGRHARENGDLERAVGHYRESLRLDPQNRVALRDLGWTQWMAADWEGCTETWNRLSSLDENDAYALNLLTHLHLYRRRYDEAVGTATRSLAIDPDQPEQSLKLARALHWSERYAEAKRLAETLAASHPGDIDIQRFWADLLMQYHDFERGLPTWQRVTALGADDARAQFYYVKSLYELGHYDTAVAEARGFAATTEPHDALLRLLADDALLRGEKAEAGGWLLRLAERSPSKVELWLELSDLQLELGAEAEALATVDRALSQQPDSIELRIARANLLRRRGFLEEAHAVYRELAAKHPESREVFWGVLQTASETERYQDALAILEANRSTFLKPYEVELERARLLYASGDASEARKLLERAGARAAGAVVVPILLYHGLGDHPRTPAMPLALFDSQMKALSEAGYQALTVSELDRIASGQSPPPPRPIVITFDDARIDSFELADPVLHKYRMKATMFVPTGLTLDGHPFFSDWTRLSRFAATGRWDLQAHGHRAHNLIEISADGTEGSFLVNRMWLPAEARLETREEYLARVKEDYQRVKREIEARVPGASVAGYAFPFSEAGQENAGNVPDASRVNEGLLSESYRFGFIQDANGYNELGTSTASAAGPHPRGPDGPALRFAGARSTDPQGCRSAGCEMSVSAPRSSRYLKRYSVPRDFDGKDLLRRLAREHPRARALTELARIQMWTGLYGRSRKTWETLLAENPSLVDDASFYLASIDYQRGGLRGARRHLESAKGAQRSVRPEEMARLERRIAWEESFRIEPRFTLFEDSAERLNRAQTLGFTLGALAPVEIRGSFGTATFEERSFAPYEALEGDVGLSLRASSNVRFDARVRQREARTEGPDSTNYWGALSLEGDRAELHLRAGQEDVDTLRARIDGIELRTYQVQHLLRVSPRFWAHLDARYGEYSDTNRRADLIGRVTLRPWSDPSFRLGAAFGYTDSRLQSQAYYTPEQLRFGRGLLSYSRGFASGWNVDASAELGWARDSLRGDRFTAYARGHAVQAWSSRFRSSFGWSFGSSPGYQSWSVTFGLHYGFTEAAQSGFTAQ
jgi:tetratricopeptide (TPR) repeat protein